MGEKINKEDNIDLINMVLMLNQNALISLGETSRFVGGIKKANLPHARQSINMIKALKDKTTGNLTPGEAKLILRVLGELQSKYVKAAGLDSPGPVKKPDKKGSDAAGNIEAALESMSNDDLSKILSDLQKKSYGKN